jgi:hypothetical protein
MRIEEAAKPTFARHETFHPRYGWFKKGHDGALHSPGLFLADGATVELGVGKNMVRAIRFWGHAAKILAPVSHVSNRRTVLSTPSRIGNALLSDDGWDPYCEDPASLWLLHWWMLAPPSILPVWWASFHEFTDVEFSDDDLSRFAVEHISSTPGWQSPHETSINKDVSCLLRTYGPTSARARAGVDDLLDCPFRDLGLLSAVAGRARVFRFLPGAKPTLPSEVVLFAALDFLARTERAGAQTVTISRLATEPGGPGRAFRLTEAALSAALETAARGCALVKLAAPAGVGQLHFDGSPDEVASAVIASYFADRRDRLDSFGAVGGPDGDLPCALRPAGLVTA